MAGEATLSPRVTRRLIDPVTAEPAAPVPTPDGHSAEFVARLTARERDVVVAVGHGLSNAGLTSER